VGFVPNTDFLQANFASMLSPKGHIKVNEHLQVRTRCAHVCVLFSPCPVFASHVILSTHAQAVDYPNIFALGDVADINEEKLAQVCECRSRCGEQQQHG
jgi:thioredoxin reductase